MATVKTLSFLDMNGMSDKHLTSIQATLNPLSEQYKMIDYELRIRKIELPEELKLNN